MNFITISRYMNKKGVSTVRSILRTQEKKILHIKIMFKYVKTNDDNFLLFSAPNLESIS